MEYENSSKEYQIDKISMMKSTEICQICGDENAKSAYGVVSCASCKIFFRRNAQIQINKSTCRFAKECQITMKNRHTCRYCRLKKCLSIGMSKDLLRASHGAQGGNKRKIKLIREQQNCNENKICSMVPIYSLDLLNNDRSSLGIEQWSLLSNITNAYNSRSPIASICYILSSQSVFPPKIRLKLANTTTMDILRSMYNVIHSFISIIPEFSSMKIDQRTALITRNIQNLGAMNCEFMMRETNIVKDAAYASCLSKIYGSLIFNGTIRINQNLDIDGTFLKLLLIVLAFSTCCDVVSPVCNPNINRIPEYLSINTKHLFEIQNKYVELMFKYMIYRCGYYEAALRFASLMRSFLCQTILTAQAAEIEEHDNMIKTVVDKTEQVLILEDQFNY